jgi:DNA-binding NtrC family response regulator
MSQPLREIYTNRVSASPTTSHTRPLYALKDEDMSDRVLASTRIDSLKTIAMVFLREVEALKHTLARKQSRKNGEPIDLDKEIAAIEAGMIKWALMSTGGNQAAAAKLLSLNATTLHSKMKRHGITADDRYLTFE